MIIKVRNNWIDVDKMLTQKGVVGNRRHAQLMKGHRKAIVQI